MMPGAVRRSGGHSSHTIASLFSRITFRTSTATLSIYFDKDARLYSGNLKKCAIANWSFVSRTARIEIHYGRYVSKYIEKFIASRAY